MNLGRSDNNFYFSVILIVVKLVIFDHDINLNQP